MKVVNIIIAPFAAPHAFGYFDLSEENQQIAYVHQVK